MAWRICRSCDGEFELEPGKEWARECFACWKQSKIDDGTWRGDGGPASAFLGGAGVTVDRFRNEFNDQLDALIWLCHPDRHKNSDRSNQLTMWLLEQRELREE